MFLKAMQAEPVSAKEEKESEIRSLAYRGKESLCKDIIEAIEEDDAYGLMYALEKFIRISKLLDEEQEGSEE